MRVTRAWVFALLAIGLPILILVAARGLLRAAAEDWPTTLALGLLAILFAAWALLAFSTLAAITAKPTTMWGRAIRLSTLLVLGGVSTMIGVYGSFILLIEPEAVLLFGLPVLLLPLGMIALASIWADIVRPGVNDTHDHPSPP